MNFSCKTKTWQGSTEFPVPNSICEVQNFLWIWYVSKTQYFIFLHWKTRKTRKSMKADNYTGMLSQRLFTKILSKCRNSFYKRLGKQSNFTFYGFKIWCMWSSPYIAILLEFKRLWIWCNIWRNLNFYVAWSNWMYFTI